MLDDVLSRIRSARTALSNRARVAISKWAGPAAAVEMTRLKAAKYRTLVGARGRVERAGAESKTVEARRRSDEAGQSALEFPDRGLGAGGDEDADVVRHADTDRLSASECRLEAHHGGHSIWAGILWALLGLVALFGEGVLNRISLPYILSIDPQSLDGWVLPISATLGPILLHCLFDALAKWSGRHAPLVRAIPVVFGSILALWFVFDVASLRGQAIAFMLNPESTETAVSPEQINQTMKLLGVGIGWWAGTFFFLASRHLHGRSLTRMVARQRITAAQAQQESVAARGELDIAEYEYARIDQTAAEEAEASLAQVLVEAAFNEGQIGSGEDEVNRRLADRVNANLIEMPTPELPPHSAWRKSA